MRQRPDTGQPPHPSLLMGVAVLVMLGIGVVHYVRIEAGILLPMSWLGCAFAVALAGCLLRRNIVFIIAAGLSLGAVLDTLQWQQFDAEACEGTVHEAVIVDAPRHRARSSQMKVRLTGQPLSPVMLTTLRDTTLSRGRHILFRGRMEKVRPAFRPYFHYDTWLLHQGVYWRAFAPRHALVPDSAFTPPVKERLLSRLRSSSLSAETEGIVEAMVLGSKDNITPQMRQIYSDAGGSHLLALSGLHLGIVAGLLMLLLGRSYRLRFLRLAIALPLVWGYVWLTGAPPSLVRAAVMFSTWLLTDSIGRHTTSADSLTFAVLAILVVRPFWLFDTGFQLSAISLLGITSISAVQHSLGLKVKIYSPAVRYMVGLLTVGFVATIATAPVVAATFHRLPLWGWAMSLVYIPITTIVVPSSMLLMAMPMQWLAEAIDALLRLQMWLMQHTGTVIDGLYPSWITVALSYAVMLLFVYRRYVPMAFAAATLILSLVADRRIPITPTVDIDGNRAVIVHSRRTIHYLPSPDTTYYRQGIYSCGDITLQRLKRGWVLK